MSGKQLARRALLVGIALAAGGVTYAWRSSVKRRRQLERAREVLHRILEPAAFRPLGAAYLAQQPAAARVEDLLGALERRLATRLDTLSDHDSAFGQIAAAIERDLEAGDVVELDGWVVAETAALIAGLCQLLES
jgi:hypothetical protein